MNVLAKIAKYRDERGWTNNRLCVESGIGSATIVNWFGRNSTPKLEAIQKLCDAFDITMSEFFNDSDQPISLTERDNEMIKEWMFLTGQEKEKFLELFKTLNKERTK